MCKVLTFGLIFGSSYIRPKQFKTIKVNFLYKFNSLTAFSFIRINLYHLFQQIKCIQLQALKWNWRGTWWSISTSTISPRACSWLSLGSASWFPPRLSPAGWRCWSPSSSCSSTSSTSWRLTRQMWRGWPPSAPGCWSASSLSSALSSATHTFCGRRKRAVWKERKIENKLRRRESCGQSEKKITGIGKRPVHKLFTFIFISRSKVDDVFFVVFPIMFLVFNLIYWPMCLSSRHGTEPEWQGQGVGGAKLPTPLDTMGEISMGLPLGLYTHHYGKGCGKQGHGGGKKCQYHGVNQVSLVGIT